jgi:hypothetical protein
MGYKYYKYYRLNFYGWRGLCFARKGYNCLQFGDIGVMDYMGEGLGL